MSDALFDATPYGPERKARGTTPPQTTETVEVAGERWNGTSKTTPGVAHYIVGPKLDKYGQQIAAAVSMCGIVVVPHTYGADEQRPGCAACAARVKTR